MTANVATIQCPERMNRRNKEEENSMFDNEVALQSQEYMTLRVLQQS